MDDLPETGGRWKRNVGKDIEEELSKDVNLLAKETHTKPWMVLTAISITLAVVVGLLGFCVWRFCRKKRKPEENKKDLDEEGLMDLEEEADVNDVDPALVRY